MSKQRKKGVTITMTLTVATTMDLDELKTAMLDAVTIRSVQSWLDRRGIEYHAVQCNRLDVIAKGRK